MKTANDPRHIKRRSVVKELFAYSFNKNQKIGSEAKKIIVSINKIDKIIAKSAPSWPVEKINHIDLAILRCSIFEILEGKTPLKVIVDESIEIAKEFGGENSPSFINGALGSILKTKINKPVKD